MSAPRDFAAELRAAREEGDWDAHAQIWDERIAAAVDGDEKGIHRAEPTAKLLAAVEAILASHELSRHGGPLIDAARKAVIEFRSGE